MRLTPSNIDDLQQSLAKANAAKSRMESVDLSALNRVLEHAPEDMTVTVQGGATLATFANGGEKARPMVADRSAKHGQSRFNNSWQAMPAGHVVLVTARFAIMSSAWPSSLPTGA